MNKIKGLKTLKDINWLQKDVDDTVIATDTKELRLEAIKWIKELNKVKDSYCLVCGIDLDNEPPTYNYERHNKDHHLYANEECIPDLIDWIKHFFNIKDDICRRVE